MIQLAVTFISAFFLLWLERKIKARSQFRVGPPIYQQVADIIKLLKKENIRNNLANPSLIVLPLVYFSAICIIAAYLPFGNIQGNIDMITLVFFLSLTSFVYAVSGLFSYSPYGFYGAKREVLQLISYEIPFMLSVFSVGIFYKTFSIKMFGFAIPLLPAAFIYYVSMLAELRRSPFDIPNAVQEIIEGSDTEFSGPALAFRYLAEWIETFALCSLFYILFIGIPDPLVHLISIFLIFTSVVLVDILTPRLTIKHLIKFFWKYMFPLSVLEVILCYLLTL